MTTLRDVLHTKGLAYPLMRQGADFLTAESVAVIKQNVELILGTREDDGRMTGELPWRTDFGSQLHRLQYMAIDSTFAALYRARVVDALSRWESRVRVTDVVVHRQYDALGQIIAFCRVRYDIVLPQGTTIATGLEHDIPLAA